MKRLSLLIFLVALFFFPLRSFSAHADAGSSELYAVAAQNDVWFYAAENEESGLFILPYTYYVRVLNAGTAYCYVQYLDDAAPYKSIKGYCRTEDLTFVDFIPERPFLRRQITVTYRVTGGDFLMGNGSFDRMEKTFVYYGLSYSGTARFYYVYADGVFDYVPAMQDVAYELNTDYLKEVSGSAEEKEPPKEGLSVLQIALICAAGLAAAVIAVFVLRGKRPASAPQEAEF